MEAQIFSKKFKLPDGKIPGRVICGGACLPGNFGIVMPLYEKTYEPNLEENSDEKLIAFSILGRTYSEFDITGSKAWRCSETLHNPFQISDIVRLANTGEAGTAFNYKKTEKLNFDINATVQSTLDDIKTNNPNIEPTKISEFGAKVTAAYSKFNGKDLSIVGRYSQWGLNDDVIESLVKDINYNECKKFLKDHKYRIILSIGMVYFDISYGENNLDKVATELEAQAAEYGIKGNISVTFKREISKNLNKVKGILSNFSMENSRD